MRSRFLLLLVVIMCGDSLFIGILIAVAEVAMGGEMLFAVQFGLGMTPFSFFAFSDCAKKEPGITPDISGGSRYHSCNPYKYLLN